MDRVVIFGNSGSGKTTLARRLVSERALVHLDLDTIAWAPGPRRRHPAESAAEIEAFLQRETRWVVEGCYGDLLELVLPCATEIHFLNPGTEVCVANCRRRPWEPEKYCSMEDQDSNLPLLLDWVRSYRERRDEYSLSAHRRLFDAFAGPKIEHGVLP